MNPLQQALKTAEIAQAAESVLKAKESNLKERVAVAMVSAGVRHFDFMIGSKNYRLTPTTIYTEPNFSTPVRDLQERIMVLTYLLHHQTPQGNQDEPPSEND